MIKVAIVRQSTGPTGTFGILRGPMFECYTLERPATGDHPCIPAGTYKVVWTSKDDNPTHGPCYQIMGVKGRTDILIHPANWFDQLLGCVALGRSHQEVEGERPKGAKRKMEGVSSSRDAVAALVAALDRQDFELTISWAEGVA